MPTKLAVLSLREDAARLQSVTALSPAQLRAPPARYRNTISTCYDLVSCLPLLRRRSCLRRTATSATLQATSDLSTASAELQHKRTALDSSILIQGMICHHTARGTSGHPLICLSQNQDPDLQALDGLAVTNQSGTIRSSLKFQHSRYAQKLSCMQSMLHYSLPCTEAVLYAESAPL